MIKIDDISLKITVEQWQLIESALLRLPGANGVHEAIDELRGQVMKQVQEATAKMTKDKG